MNHSVWMFAATYPEWLNWIAVGRIRCNGRITRVNGVDDHKGFALLLDRAPDISIDDDQAYIIAKLKPNFRSFQQDVLSATSQELTWLLIEAVDEFIPVSDRGARLIEADSQRAKVKIGSPIFQNSWKDWTSTQKQLRADIRGHSLVKVMGLGEPDLNAIPKQIIEYLNGTSSLPNADKASELAATAAFAWASSFAIFGELVGDDEKRKQTQELGLRNLIEQLRQVFTIREPVIKDNKLKEIAATLSQVIKTTKNIEVSVLQLAVTFHYSDLINSGKEISLSSLVTDIGELIIECGTVVGANAAYFIGKFMDDIAVTTLVYSSSPNTFSALIPQKISQSIDVGKYVTERQLEIAIEHENMLKTKFETEKLEQLAKEEATSREVITSKSKEPATSNEPSVPIEVKPTTTQVTGVLQQSSEHPIIDLPSTSNGNSFEAKQASGEPQMNAPAAIVDELSKPQVQINMGLFENVSSEVSTDLSKLTSKAANTRRKKS